MMSEMRKICINVLQFSDYAGNVFSLSSKSSCSLLSAQVLHIGDNFLFRELLIDDAVVLLIAELETWWRHGTLKLPF